MTKADPRTAELELSSVETMDTAKLMRFVELIIKLDNERLRVEAEEKAKEEVKE